MLLFITLVLLKVATAAPMHSNNAEEETLPCISEISTFCPCGKGYENVLVKSCVTEDSLGKKSCQPCPGVCHEFAFCEYCDLRSCSICPAGRYGQFCEHEMNVTSMNSGKFIATGDFPKTENFIDFSNFSVLEDAVKSKYENKDFHYIKDVIFEIENDLRQNVSKFSDEPLENITEKQSSPVLAPPTPRFTRKTNLDMKLKEEDDSTKREIDTFLRNMLDKSILILTSAVLVDILERENKIFASTVVNVSAEEFPAEKIKKNDDLEEKLVKYLKFDEGKLFRFKGLENEVKANNSSPLKKGHVTALLGILDSKRDLSHRVPKRSLHDKGWCTIPLDSSIGRFQCILRPYKGMCSMFCHKINGSASAEYSCNQEISKWEPEMRACQAKLQTSIGKCRGSISLSSSFQDADFDNKTLTGNQTKNMSYLKNSKARISQRGQNFALSTYEDFEDESTSREPTAKIPQKYEDPAYSYLTDY